MNYPEYKGFMDCKFTRLTTSADEDAGDSAPLRIRFIRNLKYCDLFARNEKELKEWVSCLGRVMLRTDFHERFKVKKALGVGSFAKVYLATNCEDNQMYAVKAFNKETLAKQKKGKDAIKNEIQILSELNHPNLMHLYEVHESKNSLYLVCEYLNGGSLNEYLKACEDFLTLDEILNVIG